MFQCSRVGPLMFFFKIDTAAAVCLDLVAANQLHDASLLMVYNYIRLTKQIKNVECVKLC